MCYLRQDATQKQRNLSSIPQCNPLRHVCSEADQQQLRTDAVNQYLPDALVT